MATVSDDVHVRASLAEAWDFYFEPRTWASWVDQFSSVISESDDYPAAGSTLRWRSVSAGRGEVTEEVLEHEPRSLHRISFSDPESEGEMTTRFEIESGAEPGAPQRTRVVLELSYGLSSGGLFGRVADFLFVRSQMRRSLGRTLERFKVEVEDRAASAK
jgi:uncharacterized membrane protein